MYDYIIIWCDRLAVLTPYFVPVIDEWRISRWSHSVSRCRCSCLPPKGNCIYSSPLVILDSGTWPCAVFFFVRNLCWCILILLYTHFFQGTAVFWYNLFASGEGDYSTRHAACPVLVGNKWGKPHPPFFFPWLPCMIELSKNKNKKNKPARH